MSAEIFEICSEYEVIYCWSYHTHIHRVWYYHVSYYILMWPQCGCLL